MGCLFIQLVTPMLDVLDKLADYLVSVIITFVIIIFLFFKPTLAFLESTATVRDQVVVLTEENAQLKERLSKLVKAVDELEVPESLKLALSVQELENLVGSNTKNIQNNSELIGDIDGLLVNDKEKLKSIFEINADYKHLSTTVKKLESSVEKNEDRIFSAVTIREGIILAILLVIVPFTMKLYVAKKR